MSMAFNVRPPVMEYTSFDNPSPEEEARPSLLTRIFGRKRKFQTPDSGPDLEVDRGSAGDEDYDLVPPMPPPVPANAVEERFLGHHSPSLSEDSYVGASTEERREMVGLMRWLSRVLYVRDPSRRKEYRRYWMADRDCSECYECGDRFSTFRRRHHCRICGHIFCGRCSSQAVPGSCVGLDTATVRACFHCARMYHRYARVQQGLPEGATDEWVVSEATRVSSPGNDANPYAPGAAGLMGASLGPPGGAGVGPGLAAAGGGEGLGELAVRTQDGALDVAGTMMAVPDRRGRDRRGSYGSLPDSSLEATVDAEDPALHRQNSGRC